MNYARPALLAWSSRYGNLREVTRCQRSVSAGVQTCGRGRAAVGSSGSGPGSR